MRKSLSLFNGIIILGILSLIVGIGIVYAAQSYRSNSNTTITIDKHGICKEVTNTGSKSYFIPTKTSSEWSLFRSAANSLPKISLAPCQYTVTLSMNQQRATVRDEFFADNKGFQNKNLRNFYDYGVPPQVPVATNVPPPPFNADNTTANRICSLYANNAGEHAGEMIDLTRYLYLEDPLYSINSISIAYIGGTWGPIPSIGGPGMIVYIDCLITR